jgi:uncharacterized protein (TIGR02594 family)
MTLYESATNYIGLTEHEGESNNNSIIMEMLKLDTDWPENDEVPWCSAFVNYVAWKTGYERTKNLRARSWLKAGKEISLHEAESKNDIVIFSGENDINPPGPDNTTATGHVAFFSSYDEENIYVLGGNQDNTVKVKAYPKKRFLGVRRLSKKS